MRIEDNGWDSRAWLDGDWLHREPRRAEVRPRLLAETRLLPWLAPQLPLPVPVARALVRGTSRAAARPAGDVESGLKGILARL